MLAQRILAVAASLAFLACVGCAGSSEYMGDVPATSPIGASDGLATIVFLRPSGIGFGVNFTILDQEGRWLGEAVAKSHFAVALPPGKYFIVGWSENSAPLDATLEAGRVYYVEVVPQMGVLTARVSLEALSPRSEDWGELGRFLRETNRLVPLPAGTADFSARKDEARERVKSARENWADFSAEERERATLHAEDGVVVPSLPR
jgi:hypothetical protein